MNARFYRSLLLLALMVTIIGLSQAGSTAMAESATIRVYSMDISYSGTGSGVVEVSYGEAVPGTTVELVAKADKFSRFCGWQLSDADIEILSETEEQLSFVMPEADLAITAEFELILYKIAVYTEYGDGGPPDVQFGEAAYTSIVSIDIEEIPGFLFKGWDVASGETVIVDERSMKTSFVMPSEDVEIVAYFEPILFEDIEDHALFAELHQASHEGWLDGYLLEGSELHPDLGLTRAEYAELVVQAFELNLPDEALVCEFKDIADHSSGEAIATLASLQLISGVSVTEFAPDLPLTREQAAAIIVRVCGYLNIPEVEPLSESELTFSDVEQISPWALTTVQRAVKLQLDLSRDNNSFAPAEQMTRAEAIAQILRALGLGRPRKAY